MNEAIEALIRTKASALLREPVDEITPVAEAGEVNQVFIATAGSRKLVARIHESGELERFKKEQWCMEQSAGAGVKGPKVLGVGSQGEYAYMLSSYIPGQRADHDGVDIKPVWYTMGAYAKKIHQVPIKGFGEGLTDITEGTRRR
ncbi:MAG TPA: phosphotransferase, partial [Candidatus Polarisedimenticolaceae bacterium]|nr:phosphotransferase [Candidatus Polarisedimenticolaceae bacterium]